MNIHLATLSELVELPVRLAGIFYYIVLPILLLGGLGYLLQCTLSLDMPTMRKLNFYFALPGMVYFSIVNSSLTASEVGLVVLFSVAMILCMLVVTLIAARIRGVPRDHRNALLMTTVFYNCGNYGLPLQNLAFAAEGATAQASASALQTFVVLTQNFFNFTLGTWLAATGRGGARLREGLLQIAKFPPIYALAAGLMTIGVRSLAGAEASRWAAAVEPFWKAVGYLYASFIAIALCTLGAQLALVRHTPHTYPVKLSVLLRLAVAPLIALGLTCVLGLQGFVAQVLIISSSTPTALNVILLCLEFDNHPDFAARSVFYSMIISPITVTLTVFFAKGGFLPHLTM
jgi:predicted permease